MNSNSSDESVVSLCQERLVVWNETKSTAESLIVPGVSSATAKRKEPTAAPTNATLSTTSGTGCIQQLGDVGVIARVVTAATSTQPALDSVPKVVAAATHSAIVRVKDNVGNVGAAAAKVMVCTIPSKQRSVQKIAPDHPSTTGHATGGNDDPGTVAANARKTTVQDSVAEPVEKADKKNKEKKKKSDNAKYKNKSTEPEENANKRKKEKKKEVG